MNPHSTADVIFGTTPIENELATIHPRLHARQAKFDQLKAVIDQPLYARLFDKVRANADRAIARGCPSPAQPTGEDLRPIGEALTDLALSYRLTGDVRYLQGALHYMTGLMAYEDWGTDLTFGHWGHGMAVGYDWLYHDLSDSQRQAFRSHLRKQAQHLFDAWGNYRLATGNYYTFNHMALEAGRRAIPIHQRPTFEQLEEAIKASKGK